MEAIADQVDLASAWIAAVSAGSVHRSIDAKLLQYVHRRRPWHDPAAAVPAIDRDSLGHALFRIEVAYASDDFRWGVQVAEACLELFPNDFRVQDAVFRGRWYQKRGRPASVGQELAGRICDKPFVEYNMLPNGDVALCCAVWLRTPVGNTLETTDPIAVFNSEIAQDIRRSIFDGSYEYCGKISCPYITNDWLQPSEAFEAPAAPDLFAREPRVLNLSYDRTCNLACPSCRSDFHAAIGKERDSMMAITENHVMPLLKTARSIFVTGSGDPFAAKSFRKILAELNPQDYPGLAVTLMTNGVLLTPKEWEKFAHLHGMIEQINISVDAATPGTYAILRRGGDFERLLPNLAFIGTLRRDELIRHFKLAFVVQQQNYREMVPFVELARSVGADQVHFQMITDWEAMPKAVFQQSAVHFPSHPEHAAFRIALAELLALKRGVGSFIETDFAEFEAS